MNNTCNFEAEVTEKDILLFSQLSGDTNPLHLSASYAKTTEYGHPIAHGAFVVGFVSRVLGMYIPGQESLILSMNVRFPKPLFYPTRVRVTGTLLSFHEKQQGGVVQVQVEDLQKGWRVLEAEVIFSCHGKSSTPEPVASKKVNKQPTKLTPSSKKRRLLLTGGTGGLGSRILSSLASTYAIECVTRKSNTTALSQEGVHYHSVDLENDGALEMLLKQISPSDFYGILHLSSSPMGRAFASDDLSGIKRHLRQSVEVPLLLTQWARQENSMIKRIILLGSTAGSKFPKPHAGAYSVGKASMEHLAKILPADLATIKATINVVIPTTIPVGMNEAMPERAQKSLEARMPTGKLVSPDDVAHVIGFLLSDAAQQVNGSTITVDGGFLETI